MTLSGIEPATYRLVVQCPNQLRHQKNTSGYNEIKNKMTYNFHAIYYVICLWQLSHNGVNNRKQNVYIQRLKELVLLDTGKFRY
jgi:hypothetical protein